jgi:hypothetical protein
MKFYFDTEFTGLKKNAALISIGVISESGHTFYAESTEYEEKDPLVKEDMWIQQNVIANLCITENDENMVNYRFSGKEKEIGERLNRWVVREMCTQISGSTDITLFISDCAAYDTVLLFDLLTCGKTALELDEYIVPVVHDLVEDIQNYSLIIGDSMEANYRDAFNYNREEYMENIFQDYIEQYCTVFDIDNKMKELFPKGEVKKHNALWDAMVIKSISDILNELA